MKSLNFNKVSFQTQDVLSRTQMKNILGGYGDDDGKACNRDSDCGTNIVVCNGDPYRVDGNCEKNKCYWTAVC